MESPEDSDDGKTQEGQQTSLLSRLAPSTSENRIDEMENNIKTLISQVNNLATAVSLMQSPTASSATPSTPSSTASRRPLGFNSISPIAANRSPQQPLSAQNFFTAKPERAIDKEYRQRREAWIARNPMDDDQRDLLRNIASRKPESVNFSGRDTDWPKFKLAFRASLNSSLLLGIAEGIEENYYLNPILYSRIVTACTGKQASNLITGSVAFEDGPTAWATLNYRYERSSADRLSLA
ncbi:MAG: hypothetical protein AAFO91_13535, partial [Bacteroidota bacterium]